MTLSGNGSYRIIRWFNEVPYELCKCDRSFKSRAYKSNLRVKGVQLLTFIYHRKLRAVGISMRVAYFLAMKYFFQNVFTS